jgi:DNA-binding MarR family transcriptional regulator
VRPEIEPAPLAAWRSVLNAHAAVVGAAEVALEEAGLPPLAWYDVLWALYRAPGRRLRMRDLADEVVLSRSGLVRLVDRIEGAGLVRREPVPEDRRGAYVAITDAGAAMLRRMWPRYGGVIAERFAGRVSREEAETIAAALERVAAEPALQPGSAR